MHVQSQIRKIAHTRQVDLLHGLPVLSDRKSLQVRQNTITSGQLKELAAKAAEGLPSYGQIVQLRQGREEELADADRPEDTRVRRLLFPVSHLQGSERRKCPDEVGPFDRQNRPLDYPVVNVNRHNF